MTLGATAIYDFYDYLRPEKDEDKVAEREENVGVTMRLVFTPKTTSSGMNEW